MTAMFPQRICTPNMARTKLHQKMNSSASFHIARLLKKISRFLNGKAAGIVYYLDLRYTSLAVLVLGIAGTAIIFISGSLNRYAKFDWWNWKRRAAWSSARLWVLLLLTKGGLKILK